VTVRDIRDALDCRCKRCDKARAALDVLVDERNMARQALTLIEPFVHLPVPLTDVERSEWMTAKGRALGALEAVKTALPQADA